MTTATLLAGASVIDGTGSAARALDILVEDGRIAAIGPTGHVHAAAAERVDVAGGTLIPGTINMHVHLRGTRADAELPEDLSLLRCAQNARRLLGWGVTTAREAGSIGRHSQLVRDAVRDGIIAGPRIYSSGRIITTTAGHGWQHGRRADSADELRKAVRASVEDGVDTIKIAATGGGGTPGSNVGSAQYSAAELAVAASEAHRLGKRVLVHCNGAEGTRNAVAAGVDTIEHIGWMGDDGKLDVDASTIAAMIAKDITVVPTMSVWYRPGYDDIASLSADQRKMRAVREERTAVWRDMYRKGVRFATGTDTWDPLARELELMVEAMGLTPAEAIVAATRDAAIGLGALDELGTIEVGKVADIVDVAGDPHADVSVLRAVRRVWRGGEMVVSGGRVLR